ncbi:hypothetical protein [Chryseobacterium jejuense]|uniref:Uncharacterized protein n=1 Tax=Chryseobacterium jejuense TaxID=445960 RepID=A0A2X2Z2J8_CHRJE|nr:hypothetical protein [Chryseobacterium jejuense]SDI31536.1 hypothetical protein SAMN05421542_0810 [Chryseobacterium jejuense]SQB44760.1 Uncharacterised protein [Chryseobacterium jejuense]
MITAREFITKEIDRLSSLISNGIDKESNLQLKKELSDAIHLLEMFDYYQISKKTIDMILELPDSRTGYSDYRIMNDCESDDPAQWIELKINDKKIKLSEGDIIIKKK